MKRAITKISPIVGSGGASKDAYASSVQKPKSDFFVSREPISYKFNTNFIKGLSLEDKRALAVALKLKSVFISSRFHQCSERYLAERAGLSTAAVKKYMPIILRNDWATIDAHGIVMISLNKLMSYRKDDVRVTVGKPMKISDITFQFDKLILSNHIQHQEFLINAKELIEKKWGKSERSGETYDIEEYKRLKKIIRDFSGGWSTFVPEKIIGVRHLGKLLNCSPKQAALFLLKLEKRGEITKRPYKEVIGFCQAKRVDSTECKKAIGGIRGHVYSSGGKLMCYIGTAVTLLY